MFNILLAEDDENTGKLMETILKNAGYSVMLAADGMEALNLTDRYCFDILILDVMMPALSGIELLRLMRETGSEVPAILVTARGELGDKREGFTAGADDYMTKPVNEEELLLRIKALLRRSKVAAERSMKVGDTVLNCEELSVTCEGKTEVLPKKEFFLLYKLLCRPNKIFTRLQIMEDIWGQDCDTDEHTVNVHINRLRARFEGWKDFEIVTVRGLGYKAVKR